jgi:hypothetical protein
MTTVRSAHVTSRRSQGARVPRRGRGTRGWRSRVARRFAVGRNPERAGGTRSTDGFSRLGGQRGAVGRRSAIELAWRQAIESQLNAAGLDVGCCRLPAGTVFAQTCGGAAGGTGLRQWKARPRRRDRCANRFAPRRDSDDRQAHRRGPHAARTFPEPRRASARERRRTGARQASRLAGHILGRLHPGQPAGQHDPRTREEIEARRRYATCGAANKGAATSAVAPLSLG